MAEAGRLTVGGRVVRLRAYGLGDTRGASAAAPEKSLALPTASEQDLEPTITRASKGIKASRPDNPG